MNRRGVKPRRNREIISGIMHILKVGCPFRSLFGDVPVRVRRLLACGVGQDLVSDRK
jgi:hypothetical protein